MTDDELKAMEARANAATPEPWTVRDDGHYDVVDGFDGIMVAGECHRGDASFIAAARTDVPALAAELRRAVKVIRAVISASDGCYGHADCAHSMKPCFDARELLYEFDNDEEALASLKLRASHERYREQ